LKEKDTLYGSYGYLIKKPVASVIKNHLFRLLLILTLVMPDTILSQTTFLLDIESGLSFSQFSSQNIVGEVWGETRTTKVTPVISPLLGISHRFILFKNFHLATGIQYQVAGTVTSTHTDFTTSPIFYDELETIRMHKIGFPVLLEYVIGNGRIKPAFIMGIRPNCILSGSIVDEFHETYFYEDGRTEPIDFESEQKLFENNDYYTHPKRLFIQYCPGISTQIGNRLRVNCNYNIGKNYYVATFVRRGNHSTYTWTERFEIPASDFILSIRYSFCPGKHQK
jgi:hypothetical protein